ncbi:hypothetical protein FK529_11295 [Tsukamurella asaccharolytica]|uniref:Saccharopine dehydrogenase NADP binding domain-containing protein n=1 Tax=Tsukamurella asaccharolytica TaxID=2592067 RepID=A0A5C5R9J1_9ACTN|nr:saccharopine dehydrogenase NADP-binding domain-containing protein [Tsukamurella asaccharolytica]TWS19094.1 hypothetical protein FK529_11295 [Tsukamurella asaccharolytica]
MGDRLGRVVLLGATGHTGGIVLQQLLGHEVPIVLVGRSGAALHRLVEERPDVRVVVGDVTDDHCLAGLLSETDVVVSTVGPFSALGTKVVRAVVNAGAAYLDSTGEPGFIKQLYEQYSEAVNGAVVVPAFGYDYVLGAAAAASILDSRDAARSIRIGYFLTDESGRPIRVWDLSTATTPATRASLVGAIGRPSFVYRRSREAFGLVAEPAGRRLMRFGGDGGRDLRAVSVGGSEHFALPEAFPRLDAVDVGLGWLNGLTVPAHMSARLLWNAQLDRGPVRAGLVKALGGAVAMSRSGPSSGVQSMVIAECEDAAGRLVGRTVWRGTEPYLFTARMLAWGALSLMNVRPAPGVQGGLRAFGIEDLIRGVRAAGIAPVAA